MLRVRACPAFNNTREVHVGPTKELCASARSQPGTSAPVTAALGPRPPAGGRLVLSAHAPPAP